MTTTEKILKDYRSINEKVEKYVDEHAITLGQLSKQEVGAYIKSLVEYVQKN
ncbi:MAG: hypothetical protein V1870_02345 [Candidatus Aenigmatarchaeota archaeon]